MSMNERTLLGSNSEWATRFAGAHPGFFQQSAIKQNPKILWIGCSDSRVPENVVLNVPPGVVFTHRNIGNQVKLDDCNFLAVLEYAIHILGIQHVCIVGHTGCEGAEAAYDITTKKRGKSKETNPKAIGAKTLPKRLHEWLDDLCQLVYKHNLEKLPKEKAMPLIVKENVKYQMAKLLKCEVICEAAAEGNPVHVHGWVYNLDSGLIQDLNVNPKTLLTEGDVDMYEGYVWVNWDV